MEFLEVPLFDEDVFKMLVRFAINLFFVCLIVGIAYHPNQKNRIYVFTFLMMNLMVFFICFTMKKLDLGLGMALGLFAIFAIIRYRTDSIQVKEMTYLFIVIGISVINSLSNKNTSYTELLIANSIVLVATIVLERFSVTKRLASLNMTVGNMELIKPERRNDLLLEVKDKTGIDAVSVQVKRVDIKKGNANILVFYEDDFDIPKI